ncbi:MAG: DUF2283 domain-containing protein [Candidatus Hydrothermarchaeales archaeon]
MEKIKIVFSKETNTLDVWFDDPAKEFICEEIILKKDKKNRVIGFEKLNVTSKRGSALPFEVITV